MTRFALPLLGFVFAAAAFGQGFAPDEAVKRMQLPPGFTARVVASEPMIRQPLSISFDERGRMWVLQYLQYPNPAGLKPVKQDQYLRTVWDRVPEPPPKGPKGLDRITILSDPDEHGVYRKSKDFVSDLNLATGFCIGHGGVYVVQPPYLLFYPDKDGDDVPDGGPEVCVTGFGMEDTHSYANSLQWGPDGWLYGAHGSTVTAKIKNPAKPSEVLEFQQGIWRYHPKTHQFELFSEGGGNTYGLDFDKHGQAIAGTNWGGFAMLHQVQGAYYVKGFSKHGPLHNPHTYGYFDHVPYQNFKGGHVTCGGIVYQADTYPKEFHDQYIAGNLLSNAVYWHRIEPNGSTFKARHGGDLLVSNDTWFRPVDCLLGPDGSVYVADWYDKRAAHLDPVDNWDKTNGRVYRIEYQGTKWPAAFDLRKKTGAELIELLRHPNKWWRNEARRQIIERQDKSVVPTLRRLTKENNPVALEALWALHGLDEFKLGLTRDSEDDLFHHPNEHVRAWVVRFVGDDRYTNQVVNSDLIQLAKRETSPVVLAQLACTAMRLEGGVNLAMHVLNRPGVEKDPFIPMLGWWAIEHEAISFPWGTQTYTLDHTMWGPAVRDVVLERLARRYAAEGTPLGFKLAGELLKAAWYRPEKAIVVRGIELGLEAQRLEAVPPSFLKPLKDVTWPAAEEQTRVRLMAKFGDEQSCEALLHRATDASAPEADRRVALGVLSGVGYPKLRPALPGLLTTATSDAFRGAVLSAFGGSADPSVPAQLLKLYPSWPAKLKAQAVGLLLSRPAWAAELLRAYDAGTFPKADLSLDHARTAAALNDPAVTKLVEKHWGKFAPATAGEKQARISWLNTMLGRVGPPDLANGKALFAQHCAVCHTLHGEGGKVGPDLTTADRKNRGTMLSNIVDPSGYIRPEFVSHKVTTLDGRTFTGLVTASDAGSVTLANVVENKPQTMVVARKDIEDLTPLPTSLMPEKLLDTLTYEQVGDLFAYLAADPPKAAAGKKLRVALVSGSLEYKSDETLPLLQAYLEANHTVECVRMFRKTDTDIPGLDQLESCDAAVFFTRRLKLDGEQLDRIKKYAASGKPVVGIRTASHGFQNWLEMDRLVFGGDYQNHYGQNLQCDVRIVEAAKGHPVLSGVKPFATRGGLYKNPAVAKDVTVLLTGSIPDHTEPVAWVRERKLDGGKTQRVFYTSLGHPDDFKDPNFLRLVANGLLWSTSRSK